MRKKLLLSIITVCLLCICSIAFANHSPSIKIDLITRDFSSTPLIMQDGTVLTPAKPIAEAFKGTIKGTINTCYVYINYGNKCIVLNPTNIGEYYLQEGKYIKSKDIPIVGKVINETLYVPIRAYVEALDGKVLWDGSNNTVLVYTDSADMNYYLNKQKLEPLTSSPIQPIENPNNDALDKNGEEIFIGDIVSSGAFYGNVQQIKGNRILVYWDSKSIFIKDEDIAFWSTIAGVRYKSSNWIDSNRLTIER